MRVQMLSSRGSFGSFGSSVSLVSLVSLVALLALAFVACAPVDNSGGPPPAGTEVELALTTLPGTCGDFRDAAFLVRDQESLAAFFAACPIEQNLRAEWQSEVDELAEDDVLVHVNVGLGGCLESFELRGVFIDGTTVNAWVLRENTAHGIENAACTDDIGEGGATARISGAAAAAATTAEIVVGEFNPDLPGVPL